jgi:hypothetical protein
MSLDDESSSVSLLFACDCDDRSTAPSSSAQLRS